MAGAEAILGEEDAAAAAGWERGSRATRKTVDVLLHSVAHAPTDAMRQGLIMVRRAGGRAGGCGPRGALHVLAYW